MSGMMNIEVIVLSVLWIWQIGWGFLAEKWIFCKIDVSTVRSVSLLSCPNCPILCWLAKTCKISGYATALLYKSSSTFHSHVLGLAVRYNFPEFWTCTVSADSCCVRSHMSFDPHAPPKSERTVCSWCQLPCSLSTSPLLKYFINIGSSKSSPDGQPM